MISKMKNGENQFDVDPRPEMMINDRLREQIHDFQQFLVKDLRVLSS